MDEYTIVDIVMRKKLDIVCLQKTMALFGESIRSPKVLLTS